MSLPQATHPLWMGYHMADSVMYGQGFPEVDAYYRDSPRVPIFDNNTGKISFKLIRNRNLILPILLRTKDFWPEVSNHVNMYFAAARHSYSEGQLPLAGLSNDLWEGLWIARMIAGMRRAQAESKSIVVLLSISMLGIKGALPKMLYFFKLHNLWRSIVAIDLQDEPPWTALQAVQRKNQVTNKARQSGYKGPMPPFTVTVADNLVDKTGPGTLSEMLKSTLDAVSIEAYLDPKIYGNSNEDEVRQALTAKLVRLKRRVAERGKKVIFVPAGYDRNGGWANKTTLPAIQYVTYEQSYADPNVLGMAIFNWARSGNQANPTWGSRPLPSWMPLDSTNPLWRPGMRDAHVEIYEAIK